ncbi:hypothetical protein [Spirosoma sp. KCTC 42546]|uniref:hypothetical protein n=1 Tax=Spirosoma sp. KCTC 42546 TaxID=2520506 RepID=UPI00143DFB6F|nr:hypothetical protein [Spirosoma sp. KCTC 42546]
MKTVVLLLLLLSQTGLAQSDTLQDRYQFRYPLSKNILADAPLKEKPVITSPTLVTVPAQAEVSIIQKDSEFYKVIYNNRTGYIPYIFLEKDYETFKSRNYPHKPIDEIKSKGVASPPLPPDTTTWYGRVSVSCPIQKEPNSRSETLFKLPKGAVLKVRRHDYSYWRIDMLGQIGYAGVYYITEVSKSGNPFIPTRYTGPTYDRYEAATRGIATGTVDSTRTRTTSSRVYTSQPGSKPVLRRK